MRFNIDVTVCYADSVLTFLCDHYFMAVNNGAGHYTLRDNLTIIVNLCYTDLDTIGEYLMFVRRCFLCVTRKRVHRPESRSQHHNNL